MGPLTGIRVLEIAGLGPAPFCGMLLADMGADVIRIDRASAVRLDRNDASTDVLGRGKRSVAVDLKDPDGVAAVLTLAKTADVLIEGFRPGVAERLGIGPQQCHAVNPRLVYGRMTGWGQTGPLAHAAGHDINYVALSGMLHGIGRADQPPVPPLNLVGDYGGGGMLLALGITSALIEVSRTGKGPVLDTAMTEGSALLGTFFHGYMAEGRWSVDRGQNLIDSGAPFYDVYETADGKFVSVGPIEPHFYAELVALAGLDEPDAPAQYDTAAWPEGKQRFAEVFAQKTRDEWCALLEGTDACFAPVLDMAEAPLHPHNVDRQSFIEIDGVVQPAPAPRFSSRPTHMPSAPVPVGNNTNEVLAEAGIPADAIASLRDRGVVG